MRRGGKDGKEGRVGNQGDGRRYDRGSKEGRRDIAREK